MMNYTKINFNRLQSSISPVIIIFLVVFKRAYSSTCQCTNVTSWEELNNHINDKNHNSRSQDHLLLCPFSVLKPENSTRTIEIRSPIHVQCQISQPSHKCVVDDHSQDDRLIKISSDNVWLEGIVIKRTKVNAVHVSSGQKNVKLISMAFLNNRVSTTGPGAIVFAAGNSSSEIIKSSFTWNKGMSIRNGGDMMIISSTFKHNTNQVSYLGSDCFDIPLLLS